MRTACGNPKVPLRTQAPHRPTDTRHRSKPGELRQKAGAHRALDLLLRSMPLALKAGTVMPRTPPLPRSSDRGGNTFSLTAGLSRKLRGAKLFCFGYALLSRVTPRCSPSISTAAFFNLQAFSKNVTNRSPDALRSPCPQKRASSECAVPAVTRSGTPYSRAV